MTTVARLTCCICLLASSAVGQSLRFSNHRDVKAPDYATLRLGPFYSDLTLSQSAGLRWTRFSGAGTDFLQDNQLGEIREGGIEYPLITTLGLRNYLIISEHMDLEASVRLAYEHYPMGTQKDRFTVDFSDEGIYADLSTEFRPSRSTRIRLYDNAAYRTDFIDTRGLEDRYGGAEYERFENTVGIDFDWLMSKFDNLALSAKRADTIPMTDAFEAQRAVSYGESAAYERQFSPFVVGGVRADFTQNLASEATRPDSYAQGVSVFSGVRLAKMTQASAALGYSLAITRGGEPAVDESQGSISGSARVDSQISKRLHHGLGYSRAYTEAFEGGFNMTDGIDYGLAWKTRTLPGKISTALRRYEPVGGSRDSYLDWNTQITLEQKLTRLVALSFMTSYALRMNDSTADPDSANPDVGSDYQTWVSRLSTAIPLTRKLSFTAYGEHAVRTSDADALAYTRDLIAANLVWSHRF
jgi:hypothetical protein